MSAAHNRGRYTTPEGSTMWEFIATGSCALISFCTGTVFGWTAPSLSKLMEPDSPIPFNPADASNLASVIFLGSFIASLLISVLNKYGKKVSLCVSGVPMIIGFGLIIVAKDTSALILARFITGFTTGISMCFVPIYLGEISSARLRGSLGVICAAAVNSGILFVMILVPCVSVRMAAGIVLGIATFSTLTVLFIPESPYHLVQCGKIDEAESVLEKLRGKTDVTEELDLIKKTVGFKVKGPADGSKEEGQQKTRDISAFRLLFTVSGNRKAFFINMLFILVIQLGGYIAAMIYGYLILGAMESGFSVQVCMVIGSVLKATCAIATGFVIDRLGRRPLVLICGVAATICLLIVATYFYLMKYTEFDVTPYRQVGPFALAGLVVAVNVGIVPVAVVVQSETLDTEIKPLAISIIAISTGVISTLGTKFYLLLAVVWGFGHCVPFFIFSIFTLTGVILIGKLLPETKGNTLLQIQRDLNA